MKCTHHSTKGAISSPPNGTVTVPLNLVATRGGSASARWSSFAKSCTLAINLGEVYPWCVEPLVSVAWNSWRALRRLSKSSGKRSGIFERKSGKMEGKRAGSTPTRPMRGPRCCSLVRIRATLSYVFKLSLPRPAYESPISLRYLLVQPTRSDEYQARSISESKWRQQLLPPAASASACTPDEKRTHASSRALGRGCDAHSSRCCTLAASRLAWIHPAGGRGVEGGEGADICRDHGLLPAHRREGRGRGKEREGRSYSYYCIFSYILRKILKGGRNEGGTRQGGRG
eukprot:scaffold151591_cov29-Tisochrysis_lutea.AAC.2